MRAAILMALAACAPSETGLIVEVVPTDGVNTANVLEIFVGYEDVEQPRVQLPPIRRHDDDGMSQANLIRLSQPFDDRVAVEITGRDPRPFWVAVRAVRDTDGVLGEGGFPLAVSQPTDRLDVIEITVSAGTIEGNRGCPGFWDGDGVAHYIVPPDDPTVDCDRDLVEAGQGDCDDFDRAVYPGAIDTICDGHDSSCGNATGQFAAPCAITDQTSGRCLTGTVLCDDRTGSRTECLSDAVTGAPLPSWVCTDCATLSGDDLIDCIQPAAHKVQCDVHFVPDQGLCQDTGSQVDSKTWYEDLGPVSVGTGAQTVWTPETVAGIGYGFVSEGLFVPGRTAAWVPSPAAQLADLPVPFRDRRDVLLLSWIDPSGDPGVAIVEMNYKPEDDTCDPDGPDCSEFFPP